MILYRGVNGGVREGGWASVATSGFVAKENVCFRMCIDICGLGHT